MAWPMIGNKLGSLLHVTGPIALPLALTPSLQRPDAQIGYRASLIIGACDQQPGPAQGSGISGGRNRGRSAMKARTNSRATCYLASVLTLRLIGSAAAAEPHDPTLEAVQAIQFGIEDDAAKALGKLIPCRDSSLLHQTAHALQLEPEKAEQALKRLLRPCRPPTMPVDVPELLFEETAQRMDGDTDEATIAFKRLLFGPWDYYSFVCRALGFYQLAVSPDGTFRPITDFTPQAQERMLITLLPPPKDAPLPSDHFVLIVEAGEESMFTSRPLDAVQAHVNRHHDGSSFDVSASSEGLTSHQLYSS